MKLEQIYNAIPSSKCKDGCSKCCTNMIQFTPSELKRMGGYEFKDVCSHLVEGKCSIYENRPFVCRLFGTSELLQCEDCSPNNILTEDETNKLVHEYVQIKKEEENEIQK